MIHLQRNQLPSVPGNFAASASLLMATGGDRRIAIDPVTGRNQYGTVVNLVDDEISFASTTATSLSQAGLLAASAQLERLAEVGSASQLSIFQLFSDLRKRIGCVLGCSHAEIVLAASGTDAEIIAFCLFSGMSTRPVTTLLVAPDETGSGVARAALGQHFSNVSALGSTVVAGAPLDGIEANRADQRIIAIRERTGQPRRQSDVDADLISAVEQELKRGRDIFVHVLDTSKTGLSGVTRHAARHAAALAPGRVMVLVDACQFRCPASQLQEDIADGFMVAMTGSKFAAGPAFSGALLLPSALAELFADEATIPIGLADYTAALDWPESMRSRIGLRFSAAFNLGLALRWSAALANLERCARVPEPQLMSIKERFVRLVQSRAASVKELSVHPHDGGRHLFTSSIVPLTVMIEAGVAASFEQCQTVHLLMRDRAYGPISHVGQPVRLGPRAVLRIAASAIDVATVWDGISSGQPMEQALRLIETELDRLFDKFSVVLHHLRTA